MSNSPPSRRWYRGCNAPRGVRPRFARQRQHVSTAQTAADKYEADKIESDYSEAIETVEAKIRRRHRLRKGHPSRDPGNVIHAGSALGLFSSAEFKKLKEDQSSSFYGIGVQILRHDDGVYIQSVVENTPASRAGLRYGDRIVDVDGKDAREWSSDEVSKNVRGDRVSREVRSELNVSAKKSALNFTIVRDAVPLPSIRNAFMITSATGYIGLVGGFQHTTDEELRESISDLKKDGMRQMVLDLRNNPGGLVGSGD